MSFQDFVRLISEQNTSPADWRSVIRGNSRFHPEDALKAAILTRVIDQQDIQALEIVCQAFVALVQPPEAQQCTAIRHFASSDRNLPVRDGNFMELGSDFDTNDQEMADLQIWFSQYAPGAFEVIAVDYPEPGPATMYYLVPKEA